MRQFVFSLEPDCSQPMPPDYLTRRLGVLKNDLGLTRTRPDTNAGDAARSFDGSLVALGRFASTRLLDAGFNVDVVARRSGRTTSAVVQGAPSGRMSDRSAADHLGRVVHGDDSPARRLAVGGASMEPIRTDFTGYEGKYVAIDLATDEILMADNDYDRLVDRMITENLNTRAEIYRVRTADKPQYVGLG